MRIFAPCFLSGTMAWPGINHECVCVQVWIGRAADNLLSIEDNEVSGKHALLLWSAAVRAWQVQDAGSLNGTRLNGTFISNTIRRPGRLHRLNSDDILLLGSRTAIKARPLSSPPLPPCSCLKTAVKTCTTLRENVLE